MDGKLKDQQDEVFQQLEIQARAPGNGKLYDALFVLTNKSSFDVERHALQCLSVHERYENNVSFGMTRRLFLLDRMLIKAIIYLRNTRKASILALRGGWAVTFGPASYWPSLIPPKRRRPTMIMGYFDEGEIKDFICMAGYLADEPNWMALTAEWNVLLKKYSIPYLHLADFMGSWKIYETLGWKQLPDREERIAAALRDFIFAVRRFTISGIGIGLDVPPYLEITKGAKKREKPAVFLFERVFRAAVERKKQWGLESEPICMIFDDNKDYAMKLYASLWELRTRHPELRRHIAGIAFGNDEHFAPLQAVDLLAYATATEYRLGPDAWGENSDFRALLQSEDPAFGKLYDGEFWNREELEKQKDIIVQIGNRSDVEMPNEKRRMLPPLPKSAKKGTRGSTLTAKRRAL
jgi:hypothetical protein